MATTTRMEKENVVGMVAVVVVMNSDEEDSSCLMIRGDLALVRMLVSL